MKNRSATGQAGISPPGESSQNLAGRGQILTISPGNSYSIAQESGEIWTGQALVLGRCGRGNLQPISFKSDRLLARGRAQRNAGAGGGLKPRLVFAGSAAARRRRFDTAGGLRAAFGGRSENTGW